MKTCPRCESVLFADMNQCFDCLYDYDHPGLDYVGSGAAADAPNGVTMNDSMPIDAYQQDSYPLDSFGEDGSYLDAYPPYEAEANAARDADGWSAGSGEAPTPIPISTRAQERPFARGQIGSASQAARPADPSAKALGEVPTSVGEPDLGEATESEPPGRDIEPASDRRQDVGLFAEPTKPAGATSTSHDSAREEARLGILVHWRGLEMTAALLDDPLTIGRDRANDITLASFDVPPFAATIEQSEDGAEFTALTDEIQATLDGTPIANGAHLGAGQELDLYGAHLSLVRLD